MYKIEEFVDNSRHIDGGGNCRHNECSIYENCGYGYGHIHDSLRHIGAGIMGAAGGEAKGSNNFFAEISKLNLNGFYR